GSLSGAFVLAAAFQRRICFCRGQVTFVVVTRIGHPLHYLIGCRRRGIVSDFRKMGVCIPGKRSFTRLVTGSLDGLLTYVAVTCDADGFSLCIRELCRCDAPDME